LLAGAEGRTQGENTEVARLWMFDGSFRKVLGFVTACKLYIRMKMKGVTVEEQIQ